MKMGEALRNAMQNIPTVVGFFFFCMFVLIFNYNVNLRWKNDG
jgi:hypothetical protein